MADSSDERLASLLVSSGLLTWRKVDALREGLSQGTSLQEALLAEGWISPSQLQAVVARGWTRARSTGPGSGALSEEDGSTGWVVSNLMDEGPEPESRLLVLRPGLEVSVRRQLG